MISQSFFLYVERCQIDAEELSEQRIVEVSIFEKKFRNQILNHVTVFKEEVNSIKEL